MVIRWMKASMPLAQLLTRSSIIKYRTFRTLFSIEVAPDTDKGYRFMKKFFFISLLAFTLNVSGQSVSIINLDNYIKHEINDTISVIVSDASKVGIATNDGNLLVPVEYDDALLSVHTDRDYGKELFFLVSKNDKWGIVSNKRVYVDPKFDQFDDVAGKMLSYMMDGRYGVVTLKGKVILPAEYDVVNFYSTSWLTSCDFITALKDQQWSVTGYYNLNQVDVAFSIDALETTECIVTIGDEEYRLVSAFYGGFAKVCKDNLYGMVNPQGEFVVPVEYDGLTALGNRFFVVEKDKKCGLYRNDGKQLAPCSYNMLIGLTPDSLHVVMSKGDNLYKIDLDGHVHKQASVDDLKAKYDPWVLDCNNGQAIVYIDRKPCVMAYDGTVIIPTKYSTIKMANEIGIFGILDNKKYYKVADKTGLFAAFDEKGVQLTDFKYTDIHYAGGDKDAFAVATVVGGKLKCGVCDSTGREIIPLEYESIKASKGDVFAFKRNGKYGIVNTNNKVIIPFELDSVTTNLGIINTRMIAIKKGSKWALLDGEGKRLTDYVFEFDGSKLVSQSATLMSDFFEGMGAAVSHSKYGYFDSKGQLVIPCIYEYGQDFSCGLAVVENADRQYGFIDKKGKMIIPFVFDFASSFDPTTIKAKARLNDQRVMINLKGEVVANEWP